MKKKLLFVVCLLSIACSMQCNFFAEGKVSPRKHLRIAFVGDPQVDDSVELGYARRSVYKELRERADVDMAIILGDLVNDSMALLEPSRASLDSIPYPWHVIPGNHDFDIYSGKKAAELIPGKDRDLESYMEVFGRPDTAFVMGGIRFILMNDMLYEGNEYHGGFTGEQLEFLDSVVRCSRDNRLVVLATHIPYSHIKDRETADSILSTCPGLLLVSGHAHRVSRCMVELACGRKIQELVAGASCGSWWRGPEDEYGIPYALQNCGSPRGYFIVDFIGRRYSVTYKCIGRDDGYLASAALVSGKQEPEKLFVNIFGGSVDGKVRVRAKGFNNGRWTSLPVNGEVAPEVLEVITARKAMSQEERRARRNEIIPLHYSASPHVWSAEIPGVEDIGMVEIRYSDNAARFMVTVPCMKVSR